MFLKGVYQTKDVRMGSVDIIILVLASVKTSQDRSKKMTMVNFDHGHSTMVDFDHGQLTMVKMDHGKF